MTHKRAESDVTQPLEALPKVMAALLLLAGVSFTLAADRPGHTDSAMVALSLAFYAMAGLTWSVHDNARVAGRAVALAVGSIAVLVSAVLLDVPSIATLLYVPACLAVAAGGIAWGGMLALGHMLALAALHIYRGADPAYGVAITAVWCGSALAWILVGRTKVLMSWSLEHFGKAERALDESRDRQVELKQALEDVEIRNRQLNLLNEKIAGLRMLAEQAEKEKEAFLSRVSHEFRTPLHIVLGLAELLVDSTAPSHDGLAAKSNHHLQVLQRNCEHLASMINDVLDLSQVGAGRVSLRREWTDLQDMLEQAREVIRPLADEKGLWLEVALPAELPRIYCDRTRMLQVILNLLSNAARFTDEGGITVEVTQEREWVQVSVTDTGPGVAPEVVDTIFEPFSQGQTGLASRGGSGLGLSISKEFVNLHGGRIWLESDLGVGSTFNVRLPVSLPPEPKESAARWIEAGWVPRRSMVRSAPARLEQRVVLCDAGEDLYPLLARYAQDVEYVHARSIEEVKRHLEECPAHAVLVNAPAAVDAWALVDRAREALSDTPIMGCSVSPKATRAWNRDAIEYLVKPIGQDKLRDAVERAGSDIGRILVVDDDADALELMELGLARCLPEAEVARATNGDEAIRIMQRWKPGVVLLDIVMPGMDGWAVVERKNLDEELASIPVILVTAQDPLDKPVATDVFLATASSGISMAKLLRCFEGVSRILREPG